MFATTVASVGKFVLVEVGWSVPVGPGFVRSLLSVQHERAGLLDRPESR